MDQGAAVPPSRRIGSAPASEINYSGLIPYPPHLPLTLSDDVSVPGSEGLASNPSRAPPFLTGRSLLHKVGWERREKTPPGLCTLRPPCVLGAPHSTFRSPCLKHMLWSTYWVPGLVPKVGNTESPRREGWGQLDLIPHVMGSSGKHRGPPRRRLLSEKGLTSARWRRQGTAFQAKRDAGRAQRCGRASIAWRGSHSLCYECAGGGGPG